ncbi:hypothetical protein M7775_15825 [Sporomusa sphaeroides DSM 2875]|uniref:hypothetical protein n=1 Tax=Sporomusa sphaeroides TaxID=47679 RepID=UPI00202E2B30|nr:hypothetical protein [Sporomusa sphaeroides]MCM0760021.1 hypothetical protein [Sporomusa sphaeroides DSM 2875]
MFERVAANDIGIIARGLFILLAIIVIGVGLAEHQLTTLTQRPEQERFFYIGRNREDVYSAYAFGYGLTLGKIYPFVNISRTDHELVVHIANHAITIPAKIEIDGRFIGHWLDVWHRQFVDEAFAAKEQVLEYWNHIRPYIETAIQAVRTQAQAAIVQIKQYIGE